MKTILRVGLLSFFFVSSLCFAQTMTMAELLKGEKIKLTLGVSELPSHYKAIELGQSGQGGGGGLFESMMNGVLGAFSPDQGKEDSPETAFLALLNLSFTSGEEVTIHDSKFLITYKFAFDFKPVAGKDFDFGKLYWKLNLLKISEIRSITAAPQWSAEDVVKLIDGLKKKQIEDANKKGSDEALSRAKQFGIALVMCLNDSDDIFPFVQSTSSLRGILMPYAKDASVFATGNPDGGTMLFNMSLAGASSSEIESPGTTVMLYDSQPWKDGRRIVVFTDSSARFVDAEEWNVLKNTLNLKLKKSGQPLPKDHMVEADPLRGKNPA